MIETVTQHRFMEVFKQVRPDQFSYDGLITLFEYFEEDHYENEEFDPIAICVEYSEYESLEEAIEQYDSVKTLEDLSDRTEVLGVYGTGRIIIRDF